MPIKCVIDFPADGGRPRGDADARLRRGLAAHPESLSLCAIGSACRRARGPVDYLIDAGLRPGSAKPAPERCASAIETGRGPSCKRAAPLGDLEKTPMPLSACRSAPCLQRAHAPRLPASGDENGSPGQGQRKPCGHARAAPAGRPIAANPDQLFCERRGVIDRRGRLPPIRRQAAIGKRGRHDRHAGSHRLDGLDTDPVPSTVGSATTRALAYQGARCSTAPMNCMPCGSIPSCCTRRLMLPTTVHFSPACCTAGQTCARNHLRLATLPGLSLATSRMSRGSTASALSAGRPDADRRLTKEHLLGADMRAKRRQFAFADGDHGIGRSDPPHLVGEHRRKRVRAPLNMLT